MLFFIVSFNEKPTLYVSKNMYNYIFNLPINKNIKNLNIINHVKKILIDKNRTELSYGIKPKELVINNLNDFFDYEKR
jgi:hypothetical protein